MYIENTHAGLMKHTCRSTSHTDIRGMNGIDVYISSTHICSLIITEIIMETSAFSHVFIFSDHGNYQTKQKHSFLPGIDILHFLHEIHLRNFNQFP